MSWYKRPRGRAQRRNWITRYLRVQRNSLKRGFSETFYRKRHWTVAQQVERYLSNIARAENELEALAS